MVQADLKMTFQEVNQIHLLTEWANNHPQESFIKNTQWKFYEKIAKT